MSADCCEPQPKGQRWKWSTCGERLFFFPHLHHIHSFNSKPWPQFGLPPVHSPPAPLTHLKLLYLYQTPLSYLTSLHPSICPSSFCYIFSHCHHFLLLCPTNSLSFFLHLSRPLPHLILPSISHSPHSIFLSNLYSCNFYMAAWGCC